MKKDNKNKFYKDMGWRFKKLRQDKKISQKAVAALIGVQYQTVQDYESGRSRLSPDKLQKIADLLNVSVGYFFGEETGNVGPDWSAEAVAAEIEQLQSTQIRNWAFYLFQSINEDTVPRDRAA